MPRQGHLALLLHSSHLACELLRGLDTAPSRLANSTQAAQAEVFNPGRR